MFVKTYVLGAGWRFYDNRKLNRVSHIYSCF